MTHSNDTLYPILSCDGGGIKGLLTAVLIEKLEEKLQKPLNQCFKMFAGTSTGSLIACGLAGGIAARKIKEIYYNYGSLIFPDIESLSYLGLSIIERIKKGDFSLPLYNPEELERVLQRPDIFPPSLLFKKLSDTLITSYDTYNRRGVILKSFKKKYENIPVWEVCRASSAAPVVYPGYLLANPDFLHEYLHEPNDGLKIELNNNGIPLIDGGVVANNPALCAIAERLAWNQDQWFSNESRAEKIDNIIVASFGTGHTARRITYDNTKNWGGIDWTLISHDIPLLHVFFDGNSSSIDYICAQIIGQNYYRFQPILNQEISAFKSRTVDLDALIQAAEDYLNNGGEQRLNELVAVIKPNANRLAITPLVTS